MFRRYSQLISALVLFFFTWTLGGVSGLAHAAQQVVKQEQAAAQGKKSDNAEEQLSRLTEELTTTLADIRTDLAGRKQKLKAVRTELDKLDPEIRKQFAETEKKLKDARLSSEIMERHRTFVKQYDDNLTELKGNIERVEKIRNNTEAESELRKLNEQLQRIKAPSRHQRLDPHNLPFRQPKAVKREPRMKKEEFEQDLKKDKQAWKSAKRIQVASVGSLAGLLTSSVVNAVVPPTADELAETAEVQLTPEIRAKALELGNNPVRIYEWVRNNVEFTPTWGSIQGAQMTLLTRQGNAFDTASLLIALLRAAGIHSRYVSGTVELPIATVMNWAGNFTDPMSALDFMSSGGIPTKALTSGNKVVAARFEHIWVEAFIDYIPSRGAKHKQGEGDTWIRLDPSFKQHNYTNGIDIKTAVPFDAASFINQLKDSATINEAQGYVTGVNAPLTQQTMQDYQTRVQNYISQNHPNATVGDILGKQEIIKKEYGILLGTLPYRTVVKGASFAAIPGSYQHKLSFSVKKEAAAIDYSTYDPDAPVTGTSLSFTKSLPELAGKKITLSYRPATSQDEAVINSYLPKPHADGTPIQPSELPSQLPAYLINVIPELRIDGQVVASGEAIGLGSTNIFTMTFSDPSYGSSQIVNQIDAGVYQAIGLNLGRISQEQLTTLKLKMTTLKTKIETGIVSDITKDDLVGTLLYTVAMAYQAELSVTNKANAMAIGVNAITLPSETIFATKLKVMMLWGIPRYVSSNGLNMDADHLVQVVKAKDGDSETVKRYMNINGITSSVLEHSVPEQVFSTLGSEAQGISAAKALQLASNQGIPIYTINQQNIATILPQLQVSSMVKGDITNAVNSDKVVVVSKSNVTFYGWTGCGYIISDPETGTGAYMISSGYSGGDVMVPIDNTWSQFSDAMSLISAMAENIGVKVGAVKGLFESVLKPFGALITIIDMFMDMAKIWTHPEAKLENQLAATVISVATFAILSFILLNPLAVTGGILLLGPVGNTMLALTIVATSSWAISKIKDAVIGSILEAMRRLARRWIG